MNRVKQLAIFSIAASGLLSLINIAAGWRGGSTAATAAGVEFLGDVLASVVVLFGALLASRPADADHPYGHGRIETLAGLLVGLIVAAGGAGICIRSLAKIREVHPPPALYTMWTLCVAVVIKSVLATVKFHYGRHVRSASLVADAWNDAIDILSGMAALGAVALTLSDPARFLAADHYGGFAVGLLVIYTGIRVIRDSSLELIDTMPDPALMDQLRRHARTVEGVWGVEKVFARKTGLQYHVDLHLQVDPDLTVRSSHEIAATVRRTIRERLPTIADVLVHVEPGQDGDQPADRPGRLS